MTLGTGPVITVIWSVKMPELTSHTLTDDKAVEVPHLFLTPDTDATLSGTNSVAMYAESPLTPGSTYTVTLSGTESFELSFTFTTVQ